MIADAIGRPLDLDLSETPALGKPLLAFSTLQLLDVLKQELAE